jgi:hypothetical protein
MLPLQALGSTLVFLLIPSRLCAVGAGMCAGGTLGNQVSFALFQVPDAGGLIPAVPNFITIGSWSMNVADLALDAGLALMLLGAIALVVGDLRTRLVRRTG